MIYNTDREDIVIREYGRHVQRMIDHTINIRDRAERQRMAEAIIQLMGILNPQLRNVADFKHKLWDHLFIMSKFKLDVDSPYPIPTEEEARIKPADLPYPKHKIKLRHYGKNVETMIQKAIEMEDTVKRVAFTEIIGNFMKMTYKNWSNEEVSNELVKEDMKTLSRGLLEISEDMDIETMSKNARKAISQGQGQGQQGRPQNRGPQNRNNQNRSNNNRNFPNNNRNKRFNKGQ
jgi:hypothetical protein